MKNLTKKYALAIMILGVACTGVHAGCYVNGAKECAQPYLEDLHFACGGLFEVWESWSAGYITDPELAEGSGLDGIDGATVNCLITGTYTTCDGVPISEQKSAGSVYARYAHGNPCS